MSRGVVPPGTVPAEPVLAVEDLTTVFRTEEGVVRAVDGVDFRIREGEILGLVGESGAGKSATARSVLRLVQHPGEITGGSVRFRGDDVLEMPGPELRSFRGSNAGMVFQDPTATLNPTMTVGRQVAEAVAAHRGIPRDAARERAVELLDRVGIPNAGERVDDYPHEFSGGQRQRVTTAIAVACEPDLLVADEPTTALDVTIQAQILELLDDLRADLGMSVLFITHDLGVVRDLCDRVAVMYAGSIVETGPVESVFAAPRHPYTKGLLASIPGVETSADSGAGDHRLDVIEGTMPDLVGRFEGCKYADRCPGATEECRTDHPPLEALPDGPAGAGSGDGASSGDRAVTGDRAATGDRAVTGDHAVTGDRAGSGERAASGDRAGSGERAVACYRHDHVDEMDYEYDHEPRTLPWQAGDVGGGDGPVLEVEDLHKHFRTGSVLDRLLGSPAPVRAVDGVDLTIRAGETVGLVGESGCGKSTAARSILRLLEPTDGTVVYRGEDVTAAGDDDLRALRRNLQIVFQDPQSSLNPRRTVRRIVRRPMDLHDIGDRGDRADRVRELVDAVGLEERHLDRYPHELSGGQQQRVAIARALAVNPEVLVLDEPVSGLDVSVQAQILNLLADLQAELGLVYLLISHDLSVVRHVCDRVAVMYLGEIVERGTVPEVFEPPHHPYTEALLSAIPGTAADAGERIVLPGDVPDPSDVPDGCRFHPRCPRKIGAVCESEVPADHDDDGHLVGCHLLREEYADEVEW